MTKPTKEENEVKGGENMEQNFNAVDEQPRPSQLPEGTIVARKVLQLREKVKDITPSEMKSGKLNYKYLGENEMTKAIRPAMQELGLIIVPVNTYCSTNTYDLKSVYDGKETTKSVLLTEVQTVYKVIDTVSGDFLDIHSIGGGADPMDKGVNKANTCAFKNALRALGMFPSPERDDPDHTPSTGDGKATTSHYTSDAGSIVLKYGDHKGKTIKQVYDVDPKEVEKMANGDSKWIAGKAQEFLQSVGS